MEQTIIIADTYTEKKEKLLNMPLALAKYKLTHETKFRGVKEYVYENDDKIVSASCSMIMKFNATNIFGKLDKSARITYDKKKKKITVWGNSPIREHSYLLKNMLNYLHIDWFEKMGTYPKYRKLPRLKMLTKTLASQIISGKVKNPEEFIKSYLRISYKRNDIPWSLIRDFYNKKTCGYHTYNFSLSNILTYTKKPINSLIIIKNDALNDDKKLLLNEILSQCIILNKKIDFSWSLRRLTEEHNKMTKEITDLLIREKDNTPIVYQGKLPLLDGMVLIDNEASAFREANYMHNCIYTNYWNRIKHKKYFIISYIKDKEVYDIGIIKNPIGDYVIDQIKGCFNHSVPDSIHQEINEWFNQELVKSFFAVQETMEQDLRGHGAVVAEVLDNDNMLLPF